MTLQSTGSSIDSLINRIGKKSLFIADKPSEEDIAEISVLNPQAQNNTALMFLANRFAEENLKISGVSNNSGTPDKAVYKIYVPLPPGKDAVEYEQLEKAVIKTIFEKNGVTLSRAALEKIAEETVFDFTPKYNAGNKKYINNSKDGLMVAPKPITVNGIKTRGYELSINSETEQKVLAHTKIAQEITASGKKAFSELTGEEKLKMMIERTDKYLPQDTAEALKLIDPRSVVAGVMLGAAISAAAKRGIIASNALILVGGAITLAQVLNYGGEAHHVLDLVAQAKKPEDLDKAAEALAELTKNGAVDLFLTIAGFGAAKIAPKIGAAAGKAVKIASEYADDIARISKQKWGEFKGRIENLKGDLPVVVTTNEGIPVVTTPNKLNGKGSNVVEMRSGNKQGIESVELNSPKGAGEWKFDPKVDLDWRGKDKTFLQALEEAFSRTGTPREEFSVTKWGKDKNGKSFPVEYRAKNGAEVNVDIPHKIDGPAESHVGYQTGGKRSSGGAVRGHIVLDEVPVNRTSIKE